MLHLDLIGTGILLCAVVMILLALQWGGITYAWGSGTIIGLLVAFVVITAIFGAWLVYRGDQGLIPARILTQRTIIAASIAALALGGTMLVHTYYLPYYFQAILGRTAIISAVYLIPYVLTNFTSSTLASIFVSRVGYFNPPAILGPIIGSIGCGFLSTLSPTTSTGQWVGFEILAAVGLGMAVQQSFVAPQVVLPREQASVGTALMLFMQSLSGSVFVSVGNTLLRNGLETGLQQLNNPAINIDQVTSAGATDVDRSVPASALPSVVVVYAKALNRVFIMAIPLTCIAIFAGLAMQWKSVKAKKRAD